MVHVIAKYFNKILKERLAKSPFYGIMVDETTDKSTDTQVIIYIQYICKDENEVYKPQIDYLDIVIPEDQSAMSIKVFFFLFNIVINKADGN